jgi:CHAT domain-containing protein/tetratricopeptide (TPR) repeat protein
MKRFIYLLATLVAIGIHLHCSAQNFSNEQILKNLSGLDQNDHLTNAEKLLLLYDWKKKSEEYHLPQDSVYAKLLHKIGALEFLKNRNYNTAISFTLRALQINTSGKARSSGVSAVTDYYNIAYFYDQMNLFRKALLYYDSAINILKNTPDTDHVSADSRLFKAYIYFRMGDYEKAVEESDLVVAASLSARDSVHYLSSLIQRSQALFFRNNLPAAMADVNIAIPLAKSLNMTFELGGALKTRGLIYAKQRAFGLAEASFRECIAKHIKTKDFWQVSSDYNDLGNFFSDSMKSFRQAADCYSMAIRYAGKEGDSTRMARAFLNLGRANFLQHQLNGAMQSYLQSMRYLKISNGTDILENPSTEDIAPIGSKEMVQELFNSKTALLLRLYKEKHDQKWLEACLRTALLNDSLISQIRHEQLGEQSKLYWREMTRGFFADAIEASFLASDNNLAFFFMERSRSVLLQDKLSELGARAMLPPEKTSALEKQQIQIIELQQKMLTFPDTSAQFRNLRIQLLQTKDKLEQQIKSLEIFFPAYYQYKYAENVKSLASLQDYLKKRGQSFIEYFIQDTSSFALCITPDKTSLIRIDNRTGNLETFLMHYIHSCSDENELNKYFPAFLANSHQLYNILFRPFSLQPGRVVICQDNNLVPFETLTQTASGRDFLIYDYSFSYVYSAQYLINSYTELTGKGDFLGIAPVNFGAYKELPDLNLSDVALKQCSDSYRDKKLLLYKEASRENFMSHISSYSTATILTHARADSTDNEPTLFMSDSAIRLSELQMLNKPATSLIVLSACQTNAGRSLTGEGVYSLARGFSAAGIPAVAATQWVADNRAIYIISEKFNQLIAGGMNKDEALQKAKLSYIQNGEKGNILPYYWADLILIGNSDPIHFSTGYKTNWLLLTIALAVLALLVFFLITKSKKNTDSSQP